MQNPYTRLIVIRHGQPQYPYKEGIHGEKIRLTYGEDAVLSEGNLFIKKF